MGFRAVVGFGELQIAKYSSGATFNSRAFVSAENASAFSLSASEDKKSLLDSVGGGGGVDAALVRLSDVTGAIDLRHFTNANLAMLLWGSTAPLTTTAIVGEAGGKIIPGNYVPTKRLINTSVAVVVKKGATVILPADYTVRNSGILISATITTATVISGDPITIDYTPKASSVIEALTSSAIDVSILYDGGNEVDGKRGVWSIYKAKLGALQNLSLIGDDFATAAVSFTVQRDDTILTGSKYFKAEIED